MERFVAGSRRPLFFMHIPKTGGLSLRSHLRNQYRIDEIFPFDDMREAIDTWREAARYRLVQGHFRFNMRQALPSGTRTMTILREPLVRTVSALRHLRRDPSFHRDHETARDLTLSQIIQNAELMSRQRNVQAAFLSASAPIDDVFRYLGEVRGIDAGADAPDLEDEPSLDLAVERLRQIDHVGLTERLGPLMQELSERMHFHPVADLPVLNEAGTPTSLEALAADDLAVLREHNSLDIELYRRAGQLRRLRAFELRMRDLLDNGVYRRLPGSFELDMAAPIPGSGWYEPESADGIVWRWTGPSSRFQLEVPLHGDSDYSVVLRFHTRYDNQERALTVSVNGEPLDARLDRDATGHSVRCDIPRALLARSDGFCQVVFDTADADDPGQRASGDLRLLNIVVHAVEFRRCRTAGTAA